jgi:hypothetical protein
MAKGAAAAGSNGRPMASFGSFRVTTPIFITTTGFEGWGIRDTLYIHLEPT